MAVILTILQVWIWVNAISSIVAVALILFVLTLLLIMSIIPVRYAAKGIIDTCGDNRVSLHVNYLFRLVRIMAVYRDGFAKVGVRVGFVSVPVFDSRKSDPFKSSSAAVARKRLSASLTSERSKKIKQKMTKKTIKKEGKFFKNFTNYYAVLTDAQGITIIKLALATIKKVFNVLRPKKADISGVVGFADPSSTGLFIGAYEALVAMFGFGETIRLAGKFDADTTVVQLKGNMSGRFTFFRLGIPLLWFASRKPIRTMILEAIRDLLRDFIQSLKRKFLRLFAPRNRKQ
ncbi:MAG: hypothetical protein FWC89_11570 [Defluviitaleaceae bacterium]|nr:hypothetical protein [Defluviitaleaceae bacterium]